MSVYSELWELLKPARDMDGGAALFGTLQSVAPLTVRVGETDIDDGLYHPATMSPRAEDIGRTMALLPCSEGFLLLFFVD